MKWRGGIETSELETQPEGLIPVWSNLFYPCPVKVMTQPEGQNWTPAQVSSSVRKGHQAVLLSAHHLHSQCIHQLCSRVTSPRMQLTECHFSFPQWTHTYVKTHPQRQEFTHEVEPHADAVTCRQNDAGQAQPDGALCFHYSDENAD